MSFSCKRIELYSEHCYGERISTLMGALKEYSCLLMKCTKGVRSSIKQQKQLMAKKLMASSHSPFAIQRTQLIISEYLSLCCCVRTSLFTMFEHFYTCSGLRHKNAQGITTLSISNYNCLFWGMRIIAIGISKSNNEIVNDVKLHLFFVNKVHRRSSNQLQGLKER